MFSDIISKIFKRSDNGMYYCRNNRGVTLVELLVALMIGSIIVGLVFLVPRIFQEQNNYNHSFNTAKNNILLIANTLNEKLEKANNVRIDETSPLTITLNDTNEKFQFKQKSSPEEYLYDVSFIDSLGKSRSLGTVGFHLEDSYSDTFFILTLWAPYKQTNSTEGKFIVTQGFHTSVINQR